eukprot:COSAG06_NODE_24412_length_663_cov_2.099291_1_plen_103_part_00
MRSCRLYPLVLLSSGVAARPAARRRDLPTYVRPGNKKTRLLRHFYITKRSFYQDRLRTNIGKALKKIMRSLIAGGARGFRRGVWPDDGKTNQQNGFLVKLLY